MSSAFKASLTTYQHHLLKSSSFCSLIIHLFKLTQFCIYSQSGHDKNVNNLLENTFSSLYFKNILLCNLGTFICLRNTCQSIFCIPSESPENVVSKCINHFSCQRKLFTQFIFDTNAGRTVLLKYISSFDIYMFPPKGFYFAHAGTCHIENRACAFLFLPCLI